MCVFLLSCFSATLCPITHSASLSMGFSRQLYWSGLPCPSPGDLPHPEIESASLTSPALVGGFFTTSCCPSVSQSCLTLSNPVNHRTPGFPVLHRLPEFAQTHIHWVSDTFQLSPPLFFPSPPAISLSSGSFLMSWLFASGGQSTGASASASVLPMNIQGWFPLGLTDLISQGTLKSLLQHHSSKASMLQWSAFYMIQLSHLYMNTGKTIALTRWTFVHKVMSLLFNMLSRFGIAFLPRKNEILISWLQSPSTVILEPKKIKSFTVSIVSPSICHEVMGPDAMTFWFECWVLSQLFHSLLSPSSRGSLVPLCFLP